MVKPIDLRIGNLVLDSNDKWCIVETISHQSVRLSAMDSSYNFESKDISEIKPIPICSSVLEKFGFTKYAIEQWCTDPLDFYWTHLDIPFSIANATWYINKLNLNLKHANQLQNLVYDLTDEELEIKL